MNNLKIGKKIAIHAYKFNGWLYRTWEFPTIIKETDEYVCVSSQGANVITNRNQSKKHYRAKVIEPCIWYFFKDEWFNIIYKKKNKKSMVYINLASPYYFENDTLKYIDFDLDYLNRNFKNSHSIHKIDMNEYRNNAKLFNYPNALKNKIIFTCQRIEQKFKGREFDELFNDELLNKLQEKYHAKKQLLLDKIKRNKKFD